MTKLELEDNLAHLKYAVEEYTELISDYTSGKFGHIGDLLVERLTELLDEINQNPPEE